LVAAADRAEKAQREELETLRKEHAEQSYDAPDLASDLEAALLRACGQECVNQYRAAQALASLDLLTWVKENGGQILLDEIGWTDLKSCLTKGDVESCLWTLAKAVPANKILGVGKAIIRIASGVFGFFEKSAKAKRTLDKLRKLAEKAKKEVDLPSCPIKKKTAKAAASSASQTSFSIMASASAASSKDDDWLKMCANLDANVDLPNELLIKLEQKYGADVADGVEYVKTAIDHNLPGIGRDLKSMSEYFQKWRGKATHRDTDTGNPVAYDEANGLIVIITSRFIHAYKKSKAEFFTGGRYESL
jgi:hypothetical protein